MKCEAVGKVGALLFVVQEDTAVQCWFAKIEYG